MTEGAESCEVTVPLAHPRGPSTTSTVPCRSTVEADDLVVRIIEAAGASPTWRIRVQLAKGFAEYVATMLAEFDEPGDL